MILHPKPLPLTFPQAAHDRVKFILDLFFRSETISRILPFDPENSAPPFDDLRNRFQYTEEIIEN